MKLIPLSLANLTKREDARERGDVTPRTVAQLGVQQIVDGDIELSKNAARRMVQEITPAHLESASLTVVAFAHGLLATYVEANLFDNEFADRVKRNLDWLQATIVEIGPEKVDEIPLTAEDEREALRGVVTVDEPANYQLPLRPLRKAMDTDARFGTPVVSTGAATPRYRFDRASLGGSNAPEDADRLFVLGELTGFKGQSGYDFLSMWIRMGAVEAYEGANWKVCLKILLNIASLMVAPSFVTAASTAWAGAGIASVAGLSAAVIVERFFNRREIASVAFWQPGTWLFGDGFFEAVVTMTSPQASTATMRYVTNRIDAMLATIGNHPLAATVGGILAASGVATLQAYREFNGRWRRERCETYLKLFGGAAGSATAATADASSPLRPNNYARRILATIDGLMAFQSIRQGWYDQPTEPTIVSVLSQIRMQMTESTNPRTLLNAWKRELPKPAGERDSEVCERARRLSDVIRRIETSIGGAMEQLGVDSDWYFAVSTFVTRYAELFKPVGNSNTAKVFIRWHFGHTGRDVGLWIRDRRLRKYVLYDHKELGSVNNGTLILNALHDYKQSNAETKSFLCDAKRQFDTLKNSIDALARPVENLRGIPGQFDDPDNPFFWRGDPGDRGKVGRDPRPAAGDLCLPPEDSPEDAVRVDLKGRPADGLHWACVKAPDGNSAMWLQVAGFVQHFGANRAFDRCDGVPRPPLDDRFEYFPDRHPDGTTHWKPKERRGYGGGADDADADGGGGGGGGGGGSNESEDGDDEDEEESGGLEDMVPLMPQSFGGSSTEGL
tara:strand:- start:2758 stop:5118 length:2361 start_codon:yes stop_codon:yes gene_type:complete